MLKNGQQLGALLDQAEEVTRAMETMQNMLVSILEDLKAGTTLPEQLELVRHPQTNAVVSVQVGELVKDDDDGS